MYIYTDSDFPDYLKVLCYPQNGLYTRETETPSSAAWNEESNPAKKSSQKQRKSHVSVLATIPIIISFVYIRRRKKVLQFDLGN